MFLKDLGEILITQENAYSLIHVLVCSLVCYCLCLAYGDQHEVIPSPFGDYVLVEEIVNKQVNS